MKKGFLLICLVWVAACAKLSEPPPHSEVGAMPAAREEVRSMEQLQELALKLPAMLSDDARTRGARKMIREVVPVTDFLPEPVTRAGGSEAEEALGQIYVVNYEDEAGFAILAADKRMPEVLGYSDRGSVTADMTNPGLKVFVDLLPDYAARIHDTVLDPDPDPDPNPNPDPGPDPGPDPSPWWDTTAVIRRFHEGLQPVYKYGPYVKVEWGQYIPFNFGMPECTPTESNQTGHAPAGCVAIAMLQIMSTHSLPVKFEKDNQEYSLDWALYTRIPEGAKLPITYQSRLATFTGFIGESVYMTYSCDGSGATVHNADVAFRRAFGYQTDGIYSYHWDRIKEDVDHGCSVFASGRQGGEKDGHTWVIDGYMRASNEVSIFMDVYDGNGNYLRGYYLGKDYEYSDLVHCNWGWHGNGNGYFNNGVFTPRSPIIPDHGGTNQEPFVFDLEIIKNIRP